MSPDPRRSVVALGIRIAASAALALAVLPGTADAAGVTVSQGAIVYTGDENEQNRLSVSRAGGNVVFAESSAQGIASTFPCSGTGGNATCPAASATVLQIRLSVGADELVINGSLTADSPLRVVAHGGDGIDRLVGGDDGEELMGDAGDDALSGGGGNDRLDTGTAAESAGADSLEGGPGDDELGGGPVTERGDLLAGGAGADTADYSGRDAPLTIELDEVANDGAAGEQDNVWSDVERVIGGSGGDVLIGNGAANVLSGRDGDDKLLGRDGDDTLEGAAGEDSMNGGGGPDAITGGTGEDALEGGTGGDTLSGGSGSDRVEGDDGPDLIEGGAGSDELSGGSGNDRLNGGASDLVGADGDDRLLGGDDADVLLGADGDDRLVGGLGPDQMNGEDGRDTVSYEERADDVFVTLNGLPDDGERDEGDNVGADVEVVLGGALFNTLTGDRRANTLSAGPEEDFVDGQAGRDQLTGGSSTDVMRARDGSEDTVACGDGMDLAIVDGRDKTRDCEWVDRPADRELAFGERALVRPETTFGLRLPTGFREVTLPDDVAIPLGSRIDPQDGEVRLLTATRGADARQRISVDGSPFTLRQFGRRNPSTVLRLAGGDPVRCRGDADTRTKRSLRVEVTTSSRASASGRTGRRPPRRGSRTKVRTKGDYVTAAAVDTEWEISDRCDGTFVRVLSGTVSVTDRVLDKTVAVEAGETYLAARR